MATIRGRGGKLQVVAPQTDAAIQTPVGTGHSPTSVGQITEWRLNVSMGGEDVTEFGDTWVERITTLKDWSGDARGFLDPSNAVNQDEILGQLLLGMTTHINGTAAVAEQLTACFFTDLTNDRGFVGNIIPSFEIDGSVGGVFAVSFSFQGSGGLIYSTDITAA